MALISVLITISLLFILCMVGLFLYGIILSPEAYAQIVAALATLLVVVLTLGLRLIDDTLSRYEKFAQPRINNLRMLLERSVKDVLMNYKTTNFPVRIQNLTESSSALKKHGQFFLTKLYPPKSLSKTIEICNDLNKLSALVNELKPYWEATDFENFLMFLIIGYTSDTKSAFDGWVFLGQAKERVVKLEKEKPDLVVQIRAIREKMLTETDDATKELDSFLEAN